MKVAQAAFSSLKNSAFCHAGRLPLSEHAHKMPQSFFNASGFRGIKPSSPLHRADARTFHLKRPAVFIPRSTCIAADRG